MPKRGICTTSNRHLRSWAKDMITFTQASPSREGTTRGNRSIRILGGQNMGPNAIPILEGQELHRTMLRVPRFLLVCHQSMVLDDSELPPLHSFCDCSLARSIPIHPHWIGQRWQRVYDWYVYLGVCLFIYFTTLSISIRRWFKNILQQLEIIKTRGKNSKKEVHKMTMIFVLH